MSLKYPSAYLLAQLGGKESPAGINFNFLFKCNLKVNILIQIEPKGMCRRVWNENRVLRIECFGPAILVKQNIHFQFRFRILK